MDNAAMLLAAALKYEAVVRNKLRILFDEGHVNLLKYWSCAEPGFGGGGGRGLLNQLYTGWLRPEVQPPT